MNVTKFLTRTSYALRGTDEDSPTFGEDEAIYWLDTLNRKKDEVYEDVTKRWRLSFDERELEDAVISGATQAYDLPVDFLALSGDDSQTNGAGNGIYVITTDGKRVDIPVVSPQERNPNLLQAYIGGFDPEKLYFSQALAVDSPIVGGTIFAPGFYMPADVEEETDKLPFLDPNWGVMAVAAEVAFNDITYEDKASDLNNKANALFKKMVKRNSGTLYKNRKKVPTNIKRIRSSTDTGR